MTDTPPDTAPRFGVHAEWVTFRAGDDVIQGYLARPSTDGPFPALVQVHENLGVTAHRRDMTERLARHGYVTLTPNLYSRIGGVPPQDYADEDDRRRKAILAITDEQAVLDLTAAHDYLQTLPFVAGDRIGLIGFCMGGSLALAAAGCSAVFKAFVSFYGPVIRRGELTEDGNPYSYLGYVDGLSCPLQLHVGTRDHTISEADLQELERLLREHGKSYEIYRYPEAQHAFHDDTGRRYAREAAALAQERALRFLAHHL